MGTVSVRGRGSVATRPDEAVVSVEISALKRSREDAYREVAERSQKLDGLADELGIDARRRTTSGVSVAEHFEWEKNRNVSKGFRASTRIVYRLEEPEVVAKLLEQAVVRAEARVDGPWWQIKTDNPAHLEARRLAATDARRKAEAFAEALGTKLGKIERVAEPGTEGPQVLMQPAPMRAMAASDAMAPAPVIELQPGELFVEAAVEISFAIEQ